MLKVIPSLDPCNRNNEEKCRLARLRKNAKVRGFRIVRDYPDWSLVDSKIAPQRALVGLSCVSLEQIETALTTPLPPPRIYSRKPKLVVETPKPAIEVPKPTIEAPKSTIEAPSPVVEAPSITQNTNAFTRFLARLGQSS